jgi:hypothetical protein
MKVSNFFKKKKRKNMFLSIQTLKKSNNDITTKMNSDPLLISITINDSIRNSISNHENIKIQKHTHIIDERDRTRNTNG